MALRDDRVLSEIVEGLDHEMGKERLPLPLHFTKGAMAHLAKFMELVVGLPGTEGGPGNPLWMRQDILGADGYWYRVEVKMERLHKATPPPPPDDFHEEDYPEHIYPDWMVTPPPIAFDEPTGSRRFVSGFTPQWLDQSDPESPFVSYTPEEEA